MTRVVILFLLVLLPGPALAWGAEGHEIVALIALKALTPQARARAARLLGGVPMLVHDANWADEIRSLRPETGQWHYVNIPLAARGYDPRRDCPGGACVVAQINRDLAILNNRKAPAAAQAEALRFLIHFVGDVHQPLHAADNNDNGGNAVHVRIGAERTSLHHIWDVDVVETMGLDAAGIAAGIGRAVSPAQRKAWQAGGAAQWANEAQAIAREAVYPVTHGRYNLRLPPAYLRQNQSVARLQLARAGVRLAWLLNRTLR
jgi:hypothetical protein